MNDAEFDAIDYFRYGRLDDDPYPYWDHLRERCPVTKEPHHDVYMVTGYDEAIAVYHDQATFSNCNSAIGPFAEFPVPLEGDDVTEIIETYRDQLPFSDQLPTFDPAQAHRAPRAADAADHAETPEGERGVPVAARRPPDRHLPRHEEGANSSASTRSPYTLLVIADLLGVPEADHEEFVERLVHHGHSG